MSQYIAFEEIKREKKNRMRDKEGRICMIDLNVSPFRRNSPQTDDKRSATIPPLCSFFSEATKE